MARKSRYISPASTITDSRYVAGLYLRLSVEDGDDLEHNSIGNQRSICLDFLAGQRNITFGEVYVDNGRTGMNYKRPGFQAMLADLEEGHINCVVVKDVSRLGRNYILTSEYVEKIFPAMGVRLICVNDGFDSEASDSDRERLLMPFQLIMNDTYVKDTANKIRSSIQAKIRCGEYLPSSSSVPYGYLRSPQEGTYTIDEETAPVVQRIFELRSEGTPFNQIAKIFNQEKIPSPGKLRYERGLTRAEKYRNTLWVRGTIRKITNDSVYLGYRIHGKVKLDRLGGEKKWHPKDEWQVIPDAHPAIIDQTLFDKVQEINKIELEKRAGFDTAAPPEQDFRTLFQGKVFCGDCGSKMSARKCNARKGGKAPNSVFFNCNQYWDSNHQRCNNHYIRQEILMKTLRNFLDNQIQVAADIECLRGEKKPQTDDSKLLASLGCQRRNLESKLERLLEDLVSGILDKEEYTQLRQCYLEKIAFLKCQEMEIRKKCGEQLENFEQLEAWLNAIKHYQKILAIDRKLIDLLVEKITVFHDRSVHICLNYADPYLLFKNAEGEECHAG